jgi:sodium pump decarboxylase gamma subunit
MNNVNGMTVTESLMDGARTTLIGMTITILTLIFLSLIIWVLSAIVKSASNRAKGASASAGGGDVGSGGSRAGGGGSAAAASASATARAGGLIGDGELIAVFAAAISAISGAAAGAIRIASYKKTGQTAPAWNLRGRNEYLSGKL